MGSRGEHATVVYEKLIEATSVCKTTGEFAEMLLAIGYTIGALACEFPKDEREQIVMKIVEMVGNGLMVTSKNMGDPSDMEMIVGNKNE